MGVKIQRRQQTDYKKPNRFNSVTLILLFIVGLVAYLGFVFWPVVVMRSRARSELQEVILEVWRVNLLPAALASRDIAALKTKTIGKLRQVGIADKKLQIVIDRNPKRVWIQANFSIEVYFPWLDKRELIPVSPRAETDAARVEW